MGSRAEERSLTQQPDSHVALGNFCFPADCLKKNSLSALSGLGYEVTLQCRNKVHMIILATASSKTVLTQLSAFFKTQGVAYCLLTFKPVQTAVNDHKLLKMRSQAEDNGSSITV